MCIIREGEKVLLVKASYCLKCSEDIHFQDGLEYYRTAVRKVAFVDTLDKTLGGLLLISTFILGVFPTLFLVIKLKGQTEISKIALDYPTLLGCSAR